MRTARGSTVIRSAEVTAPRGRLRIGLALLGPAFVAAVAYVDPGNFATNFQAGSQFGYRLVWVVVAADVVAMLVQYETSKLGLATGHSLPEVCRTRFRRSVNLALWGQAEVVAMATDLAEFTGAAIGLNLLFGVPLFGAGLMTGVVSLFVLALETRGYRRFEQAVMGLLGLVAAGLIYDFFGVGHESWGAIGTGLTPRLGGNQAVLIAVGIVGATVMPHVVYLHSALMPRRVGEPRLARLDRLRWSRRDVFVGLGLAGLVNLAMLCTAAAVFFRRSLIGVSDLGTVHSDLGRFVGGGAALAFAVALVASGLSSASVGTYAGQVVMSGFLALKVPLALRRLVTMVPSLVVLALARNPTGALVDSQVVLSFGIPFALIPLALVTRDRAVMGDLVDRRGTAIALWTATVAVGVMNIWLLDRVLA